MWTKPMVPLSRARAVLKRGMPVRLAAHHPVFSSLQFSRNKRSFGSDATKAVPSKLSELGRLNHVAIATNNLEESVNFYGNVLGATDISEPVDLPEHGVTTVFVTLPNTKIELLKPLGDSSPIAGYLAKNPNGGMHHICLEVENISAAVEQVKANGVRVLGDVKTGAHGLPVVFLHPKDCGGVLTELEEVKPH